MSNYLDLLKKVGPTQEDLAKQQKAMAAEQKAKEAEIREGAKEEITRAQERIKELKEDPNKTYNRPWDPDEWRDCDDVQKFQEVWDMHDEYKCAIHEVAEIYPENAADESEAIKGYTDQIKRLQCLLDVSLKCIRHVNKKLLKPEGPEGKPGKDEADLRAKIEHYQKVVDWCGKEIAATQEKIRDELNHNTLLLAAFVEFSGITPMGDGMKPAVKTLATGGGT